MSSHPGHIHIVLVTTSSEFHPPRSDPENQKPLLKSTKIDAVCYDREYANKIAKEYFSNDWPDDDDSEDGANRADKWGIWVPSRTTKTVITRTNGLCKIEVVVGEGDARVEYLVEVVEEQILD